MLSDTRYPMDSDLERRLARAVDEQGSERLRPAVRELAPRLAAAIEEMRGERNDDLRRVVDEMLHDYCTGDVGGDAPVHSEQELEMYVDLIMDVARWTPSRSDARRSRAQDDIDDSRYHGQDAA